VDGFIGALLKGCGCGVHLVISTNKKGRPKIGWPLLLVETATTINKY